MSIQEQSAFKFEILFKNLEDAKPCHETGSDAIFEEDPVLKETISMFQEYQEMLNQQSFMTFTRG
jgi:hypothetical protein